MYCNTNSQFYYNIVFTEHGVEMKHGVLLQQDAPGGAKYIKICIVILWGIGIIVGRIGRRIKNTNGKCN